MTTEYHHTSVLHNELIRALSPPPGSCAIDCTLGGGGHTRGLLDSVGESGVVIALDRDHEALANARRNFSKEIDSKRLLLCHTRFSRIRTAIDSLPRSSRPISAICADIGVSSVHIDSSERGFSFRHDGPLDMRMDQSESTETAADIVNNWSEEDLTRVFRDYGEEPMARKVAREIVKSRAQRPISTTGQLSDLVERSLHYKTKSKKHPATKIFQALRIQVNEEIDELRALIADGFEILAPSGRLGIISFHSLEDRIVKQSFIGLTDRESIRSIPREAPLTDSQVRAMSSGRGTLVKPFPMLATEEELERNPRARSAKLRVIQKNAN